MKVEILVALISGGVSLITGGFAFIGVCITNSKSNQKMQSNMETHQAVLDERLKDLTRQVEKHNSVIERTYEAEKQIDVLKEKQRVANHRIDYLENKLNS